MAEHIALDSDAGIPDTEESISVTRTDPAPPGLSSCRIKNVHIRASACPLRVRRASVSVSISDTHQSRVRQREAMARRQGASLSSSLKR